MQRRAPYASLTFGSLSAWQFLTQRRVPYIAQPLASQRRLISQRRALRTRIFTSFLKMLQLIV